MFRAHKSRFILRILIASVLMLSLTVSAQDESDYYVYDDGYIGESYVAFDGQHVRVHGYLDSSDRFASSALHTARHEPIVTAYPDVQLGAVWSIQMPRSNNPTPLLMVMHVRWHANDVTDYVAWGWSFSESIESGVHRTELRTFLNGPEFHHGHEWEPGSMPLPLSGVVEYEGEFFGLFTESGSSAEFEATAHLQADFATGRIWGCLGCERSADHMQSRGVWSTPVDYNPVVGTVYRDTDNASLQTTIIDLQGASFLESPHRIGRIEDGSLSVRSTGLPGRWHGQFSAIPDHDGNPRLVGLIIEAGEGRWPDRPVGLSGVVIARSPAYDEDLATAADAAQQE